VIMLRARGVAHVPLFLIFKLFAGSCGPPPLVYFFLRSRRDRARNETVIEVLGTSSPHPPRSLSTCLVLIFPLLLYERRRDEVRHLFATGPPFFLSTKRLPGLLSFVPPPSLAVRTSVHLEPGRRLFVSPCLFSVRKKRRCWAVGRCQVGVPTFLSPSQLSPDREGLAGVLFFPAFFFFSWLTGRTESRILFPPSSRRERDDESLLSGDVNTGHVFPLFPSYFGRECGQRMLPLLSILFPPFSFLRLAGISDDWLCFSFRSPLLFFFGLLACTAITVYRLLLTKRTTPCFPPPFFFPFA